MGEPPSLSAFASHPNEADLGCLPPASLWLSANLERQGEAAGNWFSSPTPPKQVARQQTASAAQKSASPNTAAARQSTQLGTGRATAAATPIARQPAEAAAS